jgi:hypothetical protein
VDSRAVAVDAGHQQRGQRHQRRDEHHVAALAAGIVQRELDQTEDHPQHQEAFARRRRAPARDDGADRYQTAGDHQPHPREDVLHDRQPRRTHQQVVEAVGRLARDRHLPVVEAILAPVRHDEHDGDDDRSAGQSRQREPRGTRPARVRRARGRRLAPAG